MGKEVKQWITVNGVHVPIFEGESKEDAVKNYLNKRKAEAGKKKSGNAYDELGKKVEENRKKMANASPEEKTKLINETHDMMVRMDQMMQNAKLRPVKKASSKMSKEELRAKRDDPSTSPSEKHETVMELRKRQRERYAELHPEDKKDDLGNAEDRTDRMKIYRDQLQEVQEDIKQFESTKPSLRSPDYDEKLAALKKKEADLKGWFDRDAEKFRAKKTGSPNLAGQATHYSDINQVPKKLKPGEQYALYLKKGKMPEDGGKFAGQTYDAEYQGKGTYGVSNPKNMSPMAGFKTYEAMKKAYEDRSNTPGQSYEIAIIKNNPSKEQESIEKKKVTPEGIGEFKNRGEAEAFYRNKFAGVSATYANKMAKKLGIEGRGKDKREALAKHYADQWETNSNVSKNEDEKAKQIARNEAERKQAKEQKKETPDYNSADFRNARELHMAEREDARAAANGVKDRQALRQGSEYTFTFNGKDGKKEITGDFQGTKLQAGEAVSYFKDMNTGKVYALHDEDIKGNVRLTNSMRNRNSLKRRIDEFVQSHPNPTDRDREKVSEMRKQYNAMMEEENKRLKNKADTIREESKQQAKKEQNLQTLKDEHYKLSKAIEHGSMVAPGAEERLAKLENQIRETENKSSGGRTIQQMSSAQADGMRKLKEISSSKRFNEISFERPTTGDKLRVSVEKVSGRDYWGHKTGTESYTLNVWNESKTNEYGNHEKEYYNYGIKDMKEVKRIIKRYMSM